MIEYMMAKDEKQNEDMPEKVNLQKVMDSLRTHL